MKRVTCLVLSLALVLGILSGCSDNRQTAMSMENGGSLSINFMYLLASIQKSMYADVADSAENGWNSVVNQTTGETLMDVLEKVTLNAAQSSLVCEYFHDTVYKLTLTEEQKQSVDKQMETLANKAGSQKLLEEQLSKYSADVATMRRYLEISLKQGNLYNHFYGTNGVHTVSEEALQEHFEKNYHIVTHIYFNMDSKPKADGTLISLTEEEKAQKRALAENVYSKILAGEDFDTLKAAYSEDTYEKEYYPNGFFVTNDTAFPEEFTAAAIEMQVGEYRLTESGAHILKKLPMDAALYNTDQTVYLTMKNLLCAADFDKRVAEYKDRILIDNEQMSLLNMAVVPAYES